MKKKKTEPEDACIDGRRAETEVSKHYVSGDCGSGDLPPRYPERCHGNFPGECRDVHVCPPRSWHAGMVPGTWMRCPECYRNPWGVPKAIRLKCCALVRELGAF